MQQQREIGEAKGNKKMNLQEVQCIFFLKKHSDTM
jgi:hypothetical protein